MNNEFNRIVNFNIFVIIEVGDLSWSSALHRLIDPIVQIRFVLKFEIAWQVGFRILPLGNNLPKKGRNW